MEDTIYAQQSRASGEGDLAKVVGHIRESKLTKQEKTDLMRYKRLMESKGRHPRTTEHNLRTLLILRAGTRYKGKKMANKPIVKVPYHELDWKKSDQFIQIQSEVRKLAWSGRYQTEALKVLIQYGKFLADTGKSRPRGMDCFDVSKGKSNIDATRLLTFEDIKTITMHETNPMIRALTWVAFETGARSSELISLKIRDIRFENDLVHVRIPQTKTTSREFDIRDSKKSLWDWVTFHHPKSKDSESPLFVKKKWHEGISPINEQDMREYLVRTCKRAGIVGKKTNPRWFRKAGICDWISRRKIDNPYMLMRIVGHEQINTAQHYIEFTGDQLTNYLKQKYGMKTREEVKDANHCQTCGTLISPEESVCPRCNISPSDTTRLDRIEQQSMEIKRQIEQIYAFLSNPAPTQLFNVDAGDRI